MNHRIRVFAREHKLDNSEYFDMRIQFSMLCIARIRHLILDPSALTLLDMGLAYPATTDRVTLDVAAADCKKIASSHRGNEGNEALDGGGHAAVSATFGLAQALKGYAWDAAEYAAYAKVYAYASYAVTDPGAFESEYLWQLEQLSSMLESM